MTAMNMKGTTSRSTSLRLLSALGLALALFLAGAPAQAQGAASSAGEAAAKVKASTGAQVLGVRTVNNGGRKTYRVKILTQRGVVRIMNVPHRRR